MTMKIFSEYEKGEYNYNEFISFDYEKYIT